MRCSPECEASGEFLLVTFHSRQTPGFTPLIGSVRAFVYLLRITLQMLEYVRVYVAPNPKWKMRSALCGTNWKNPHNFSQLWAPHQNIWISFFFFFNFLFPFLLCLTSDCFEVSKSILLLIEGRGNPFASLVEGRKCILLEKDNPLATFHGSRKSMTRLWTHCIYCSWKSNCLQ